MVKLTGSSLRKAAPFFKGTRETMIWSVLDGSMGTAWADDADNPQSVQLMLGDFCFFGGIPLEELAHNLDGREWILTAAPPEAWASLLERSYGEKCRSFSRYAIRKDTVFDKERLHRFADNLPAGYQIQRIDEQLYDTLMAKPWAKDFCANFRDVEDYVRRGLGFAVLWEGEPVAGASSYTIYRGGIEIEIDTREDHRRKGLALCCASTIILACLEQGIYPSWDAATPISVALAEKLGYQFDHEYTTYLLSR